MTKSIILEIAGFDIRLNFLPIDNHFLKDTMTEQVKKDYSGFITKKKIAKVDYTINFVEGGNIDILYSKKRKTYFFGVMQFEGKDTINILYRLGPAMFSFVFKHLLLRILGKKDAFMLHASAVKIRDKAYCFMAHSGGGKSTAMKFLGHKYQSLADDSVIIKQEKGKYYLYQTPMVEKEWWIKKTSRRYEIGALYFIKKSKVFREDPFANKSDMIGYLMDQILIPDEVSLNPAKLMMRFAKSFDGFKVLHFAKDRDKLIAFFEGKK